jgi:hypothetical protein
MTTFKAQPLIYAEPDPLLLPPNRYSLVFDGIGDLQSFSLEDVDEDGAQGTRDDNSPDIAELNAECLVLTGR